MPTPNAGSPTLPPTSARRAFFKAILGDRIANASGSRELLDTRQIALLKELAARRPGGLPRGAMLRAVVGDACRNHGTCAAVCPTGALRTYSENSFAGLVFEAAACIGCEVCAVVCPESAFTIETAGGLDATGGATVVVSRHAQRECTRCDNAFAVQADEEFCPACRKDVGLFTHGFPARSDET